MKTDPYLKAIIGSLEEAAIPEDSEYMKGYMKGHFEFIGVKSKARKQIFRDFWKENGTPEYTELDLFVRACYGSEYREIHYFAMDTCARMKRQWQGDLLPTIEHLIVYKSWWDSVDFVADNIAGRWFENFPDSLEETVRRWNASDNLWLQRSSIIFQLKYKEHTDTNLLEEMIVRHSNSDEFFLRKAIGWALRQYARTNQQWVVQFVQSHQLKPLSVREAMKHIVNV